MNTKRSPLIRIILLITLLGVLASAYFAQTRQLFGFALQDSLGQYGMYAAAAMAAMGALILLAATRRSLRRRLPLAAASSLVLLATAAVLSWRTFSMVEVKFECHHPGAVVEADISGAHYSDLCGKTLFVPRTAKILASAPGHSNLERALADLIDAGTVRLAMDRVGWWTCTRRKKTVEVMDGDVDEGGVACATNDMGPHLRRERHELKITATRPASELEGFQLSLQAQASGDSEVHLHADRTASKCGEPQSGRSAGVIKLTADCLVEESYRVALSVCDGIPDRDSDIPFPNLLINLDPDGQDRDMVACLPAVTGRPGAATP